MRRTEALKIITRVLKQPVENVPAADLIYGRSLGHIESPTPDAPQPWAMQVDVLALKIAAQLPLPADSEAGRRRGLAGRTALVTCAIADLIPGADPDSVTVQVTESLPGTANPDGTPHKHQWRGELRGFAERIATAVWGNADGPQESPLAQAEDAKRRRDIVGEVGALMDGYARLTTAPWHPVRPGDLVHVHYEAGGISAAFGETYLIGRGMADGFLSMQLLAHTLPESEDTAGLVGCFAVDDDPEPLSELWMEAGPHLLTVVRDGRVVHNGGAR